MKPIVSRFVRTAAIATALAAATAASVAGEAAARADVRATVVVTADFTTFHGANWFPLTWLLYRWRTRRG